MRLSHKNILPFRGVDICHFHLGLVYDWAENGNISEYVASCPHVSRPSLVWKISYRANEDISLTVFPSCEVAV